MEIDLTKPIKVSFNGRSYSIFEHPGDPAEWGKHHPDLRREGDAYCQLFEQAPRTKLEHGKMLAMLRGLMNFRDNEAYRSLVVKDAHNLVAEIEGTVSNVEEEISYDIGDSPNDTDAERDEKIRAWQKKNPWCKEPIETLRIALGVHWTKDERERISSLDLEEHYVEGVGPMFIPVGGATNAYVDAALNRYGQTVRNVQDKTLNDRSDFGFTNRHNPDTGKSQSGGDIS